MPSDLVGEAVTQTLLLGPQPGYSDEMSHPFQSAAEMEPFVGDVAERRSVAPARRFGLGVFPAQIDDSDVVSREILQRFGEQRPRGHVRRRERVADERDFVGRRQAVERLRPDEPKHRLFDEARFRQNGRDHAGVRASR